MKPTLRLLVLLLSPTFASASLADDPTESDKKAATPESSDETQLSEREKNFQKSLTNVSLVGFFTDSAAENQELSEDRYKIESVTKGKNDYWVFRAQIQYGGRDVKMGMPLEVKWAGDTPMITLTNIPIPELGTFSARILFYDGRYAGTWSGTDHGGHMFGRIEKNDEVSEDTDSEEADTP